VQHNDQENESYKTLTVRNRAELPAWGAL